MRVYWLCNEPHNGCGADSPLERITNHHVTHWERRRVSHANRLVFAPECRPFVNTLLPDPRCQWVIDATPRTSRWPSGTRMCGNHPGKPGSEGGIRDQRLSSPDVAWADSYSLVRDLDLGYQTMAQGTIPPSSTAASLERSSDPSPSFLLPDCLIRQLTPHSRY